MVKKFRIGKVFFSQTTPEIAFSAISEMVKNNQAGYICIGNVRTMVYANLHPDYLDVVNNAALNLPDGMPIVWCAKCWGLKAVSRTVGPDLFVKFLENPQPEFRHFLLGDTEEILAQVKQKYNTLGQSPIVETLSPPFLPIEKFDYKSMAEKINRSGANIVWVAMKAPKQDFLAAKLLPLCTKPVLFIGVGAGFRFSLGYYQHPAKFWQKCGLSGLFWHRSSWGHEILWYIKHSFFLCFFIILIIVQRILGRSPEK